MSIEKSFEAASYRGAFRDYQRHLLKRLEDDLDERKLNIVTPPGSGKVLLGLEIIRSIGDPCLIVSSTEVMRNHWGEHFVTEFLPEKEQERRDHYVSYDLKKPALLTSVTYEILHAAFQKGEVKDGEQTVSFADTNIIREMQECGVHTVLLDEPHHLDSRWMDSLESFLGVLGGEFRVITLVATPPFDLHNSDWERYENLCGEITEEIHIPDLVKGRALCPHQDYVYFNYPTEEESEGILGYRTRVDLAVAEAVTLPFVGGLGRRISQMYNRKKTEFLYSHHEAVVGLMEMLHEYGYRIDLKVYSHLTGRKTVAPLTADAAQHAINLLLESQTLLRDGEKEQLINLFTEYRVMDHYRVQLAQTPKVRRTLMTSVGKLDSIVSITKGERSHMGDALRQIILTDPVKDTEMEKIGQKATPSHVSLVSVFETLTEKIPETPVGCLTDTCAILPATLSESVGLSGEAVTVEPIDNTAYARYTFASASDKIAVTARLFKDGHILVLIGSADAMGDGWDDSFVNTLILSAFNSSMVEANRIRGRVIHASKAEPNKTAHIWHLVTVEHAYSAKDNPALRLASRLTADSEGGLATDYRHLSRRFECYMGPNLTTGDLENGIERLGLKTVPGKDSMNSVNDTLLERVGDREDLREAWQSAMEDTTRPISETRVPKAAKVPVFTPYNTLLFLTALAVLFGGLYAIYFLTAALILYVFFNSGLIVTAAVLVVIILLAATIVAVIFAILFILHFLPLLINHISASASIRSLSRSILRTLKDIGEINKNAVMIMETLPDKSGYRLYIDDCSHDEQITFQKAIAEFFSPISNPRYILVRGGWFRKLFWRWSFACPSVISKSDIWIKVFEKHIRRSMGIMKFQYTRRDPGRKYLIVARNKSYLNARNKPCEKRIHLLKNERKL